MKLSIGNGRYVDADEVIRLFSFPGAETPEELAKIKAKTSPAPEPDAELFDANLDDPRSNGDSQDSDLPLKSSEGH